VSIALLAPKTGTRTCSRLTSVTVHPSVAALGAGRMVKIATPVNLCGSARILSYLPSRPGRTAMTIARSVLRSVHADPAGGTARSDSAGNYYGTDSSAPTACGRGPYTEPVASCANGTISVWNGPCGGRVKASYIAPEVDYATFSGFRNYIDAHSPYLAGVYSAGGRSYGSWTGIFGGGVIAHTAEWTFISEQSELNFPNGFSASNASAQWFANAPAVCQLMWQWSGGDGVLNGYGDFDQVKTANNANPSC